MHKDIVSLITIRRYDLVAQIVDMQVNGKRKHVAIHVDAPLFDHIWKRERKENNLFTEYSA